MPEKKPEKRGSLGLDRLSTSGSGRSGRSWFFGIGIDQYLAFPQLNNAVKDVRDIQALLIEKYDIDPACAITLFNDRATEENIIEVLDNLSEQIDSQDKLLIYYSGHGHLNTRTELGYWIPHDAQRDRTSRYILNSTIRDYIKVINAKHVLLISDACFSGSLFIRGGSRSALADLELAKRKSRYALCSGRHDEEVYDGIPGKNSPFAESILTQLRINTEPTFNIDKLAYLVVEQTRAQYQQLPEGNPLQVKGHEGGRYIFQLKPEAITLQQTGDRNRLREHRSTDPAEISIPDHSPGKGLSGFARALKANAKWIVPLIGLPLLIWLGLSFFGGSSEAMIYWAGGEVIYGNKGYMARGKLTDENLNPLDNALVELPGTEFSDYSNMFGEYELELPNGEHKVVVSKDGYHSLTIEYTIPPENLEIEMQVRDPAGHQYATKEIQGLVWMTENLAFENSEITGACYEKVRDNCVRYGLLYSWYNAREACALLGPGWRLPTSADWHVLSYQVALPTGSTATLLEGGDSGFNALPGGRGVKHREWYGLGEEGYYWGSAYSENLAHIAQFKVSDQTELKIGPERSRAGNLYSCRCVKNAD